jgi:hypothetical protein
MTTTRASADGVHTAPEAHHPDDKKDISQVERVLSVGDEKGDHVNYDRIDAEVAKYADATVEVHISEEENKRLKCFLLWLSRTSCNRWTKVQCQPPQLWVFVTMISQF